MHSTTTRTRGAATAVSVTSGHPDTRTAAMEIAHTLHDQGGAHCSLVLLFVSYHHAAAFGEAVGTIRSAIHPEHLLACTAESVLGDDQELDGMAGMSALAITIPGMRIEPFSGRPGQPLPLSRPDALPDHLGVQDDTKALLMLADPFSTPITRLLPALNTLRIREHPIPLLGGMASGASQPGHNRLAVDDQLHNSGVVGLTLSGAVDIDTIVSQGCRPVGEPLVITDVDANMVLELGGRPAFDVLQHTARSLPDDERDLLQRGLLLGTVLDEQKARFGRGDFLVRSLLGVDQERRGIIVGEFPRRGQTVQFHLRDAQAAHEDLQLLLDAQQLHADPLAVLLMSCNGRGQRLFGTRGHDLSIIRERLHEPPITGCFAAGEIGPIGGASHLHGHTVVATIFREAGLMPA